MASKCSVLAFAILILGTGSIAHADRIDSEATITVIEDGETPDDILKVIDVPDHQAAGAQPANASEAAAVAKDEGRGFGELVSQDARERDRTDVRTDNRARTRNVPN